MAEPRKGRRTPTQFVVWKTIGQKWSIIQPNGHDLESGARGRAGMAQEFD